MSKNLYVAAAETDSGKSLIVLGLMSILTRHVKRVGFFRPIVHINKGQNDPDIELVSRHFNLPFDHNAMFGLTSDEAFDLFQKGKSDEILTTILTKYKQLESKCDFVLCEGSDYTSSLKPFEFEYNARLANNVGAPILAVVNGREKSVVDIADTIQLIKSVLIREKCTYMGFFVNRVNKPDMGAITGVLDKYKLEDEIDFVIPELDALQKLTIRQISNELNAKNELIVIKHIYPEFGFGNAKIIAYLYSNKKDMERIEPEYAFKKGLPREKKEEKKQDKPKADEKKEEVKQEQEKEKPAEQKKPEQKQEGKEDKKQEKSEQKKEQSPEKPSEEKKS